MYKYKYTTNLFPTAFEASPEADTCYSITDIAAAFLFCFKMVHDTLCHNISYILTLLCSKGLIWHKTTVYDPKKHICNGNTIHNCNYINSIPDVRLLVTSALPGLFAFQISSHSINQSLPIRLFKALATEYHIYKMLLSLKPGVLVLDAVLPHWGIWGIQIWKQNRWTIKHYHLTIYTLLED